MNQTAIFLPVLALMGWTFLVLLLIPYRRFKAAFAGQVGAKDFLCGESDKVPQYVLLPNRAFMNLFEMPVLFYLLAMTIFITRNVDAAFVALAWFYVGLRVLHSLIFLTYNHVVHRFLSFAISNLLVLAIWVRLIILFTK